MRGRVTSLAQIMIHTQVICSKHHTVLVFKSEDTCTSDDWLSKSGGKLRTSEKTRVFSLGMLNTVCKGVGAGASMNGEGRIRVKGLVSLGTVRNVRFVGHYDNRGQTHGLSPMASRKVVHSKW